MLLACSSCHRQYDVSDFPAGSRVRCTCGAVSVVGEVAPRQVAVQHCGNCGGRIAEGAASCAYCSARLTAADRGHGGSCPECFAGYPEGARFCPGCGVELAPEAVLRALTDTSCPRCSGPIALCESEHGSFHECTACSGVWLSREAFEAFLRRRESEATPPEVRSPFPVRTRRQRAAEPARSFRCPTCGVPMRRREYALFSGVVVDRCTAHGWWFDAGELEEIEAFVRQGGLQEARRRVKNRAAARRRRSAIRRKRRARERREGPLLTALVDLLSDG